MCACVVCVESKKKYNVFLGPKKCATNFSKYIFMRCCNSPDERARAKRENFSISILFLSSFGFMFMFHAKIFYYVAYLEHRKSKKYFRRTANVIEVKTTARKPQFSSFYPKNRSRGSSQLASVHAFFPFYINFPLSHHSTLLSIYERQVIVLVCVSFSIHTNMNFS